ncbi:MAG: hypothetical protein RXQ56_06840 [Thermoproteus sp.]
METEQVRKLLEDLPRRLDSAVDEIKTVARALEDVLGGMKKAEERLKASAAR